MAETVPVTPAGVDILLATFNGEKFLAELLDSLVSQSASDWHLIARDDGSSDRTPQILESYRQRHPDRITVLAGSGRRLGPAGNFSALLEASVAQRVMFCDQDDLWLPGKIALTLAALLELETEAGSDTPLMVYSDLKVVDEELRPVADSVWLYQGLDPANGGKLNRLMLQNVASGCTMMINGKLRDLALPIPPEAVMHDWWLALVAAAFGRSTFLTEPTVLYRQHAANAVGAGSWSLAGDLRRVLSPSLRRKLIDTRDALLMKYQRQAEAFLERFGTRLSPGDRDTVSSFARLSRQPALVQKYLILKYGFFYSNPLVTAGMLLFRW